jgi:hypothetical protein
MVMLNLMWYQSAGSMPRPNLYGWLPSGAMSLTEQQQCITGTDRCNQIALYFTAFNMLRKEGAFRHYFY